MMVLKTPNDVLVGKYIRMQIAVDVIDCDGITITRHSMNSVIKALM